MNPLLWSIRTGVNNWYLTYFKWLSHYVFKTFPRLPEAAWIDRLGWRHLSLTTCCFQIWPVPFFRHIYIKRLFVTSHFDFCHFFSFVRRFRSFPKFLRLWYRSFNFCDFETLTFVTRDFWFSVTSHYLGVIISVKNNLDLSSKPSGAWRRKKLIKFSPWQQSKSQRIYGRNF